MRSLLTHIIFSLLAWLLQLPDLPSNVIHERKSIAIVGAGSAGLSMLKTLLDIHEHNSWNIVLFEEKENVGGIWLPDPDPAPPPIIPRTPLYPGLHTNMPVPVMTYPNIPHPAGTHLYANHEHVESYLVSYAHRYDLLPYIQFNHKVLNASWLGTPTAGRWNVTFSDHRNETHYDTFEHLIVASGNDRIPRAPTWPGQDEWLAGGDGTQREIIHSAWYRHPEKYTNKSILIVGSWASGRDVAAETASLVSKSYISIRTNHDETFGPLPPSVIRKPVISHFTRDSIVFVDKTEIEVDSVILATGYQLRKPFLDAGHALVTDPTANSNNTATQALVSNTHYIFPLYRHIFSLSPMYPTAALAFVGLPVFIAKFPSNVAQSIFIAYVIRNSGLLPSRQQMLHELALQEQESRSHGVDPYANGHKMLSIKQSNDYQDDLLDYLKVKGVIANDGEKFVEEWRRKSSTYKYLQRGWKRVEALGTGDEWMRGVSTEEEWSDLMQRVNAWQKEYEEHEASR